MFEQLDRQTRSPHGDSHYRGADQSDSSSERWSRTKAESFAQNAEDPLNLIQVMLAKEVGSRFSPSLRRGLSHLAHQNLTLIYDCNQRFV